MYRTPGSNELNEWFAFRVRPRHEKQVSLALREKGFTEFLPLYKSKRQNQDRGNAAFSWIYFLHDHAFIDRAGFDDEWGY
jgi:hypothetical protein